MDTPRLIAVDWGTSSLRAWRFDAAGAVAAEHRSDQGLLRVAPGGFAAALRAAIGGWLHDGSTVLMSGMVGSRQGWAEAPYVATPCGPAELAAALIEVPFDCPCRIVPGVMSRGGGAAAPDVMRGEETQLTGLDDQPADSAEPAADRGAGERGADSGGADGGGAGGHLAVLPGTHSKWVWRDAAGRIAWFRTFMTGELFDLLGEHGLLARSMSGPQIDAAGFAAGLAQARAPGGLLEKLFSLRARWLFGELADEQTRGYLSGLLLGTELADAQAALAREAHSAAGVGDAGAASAARRTGSDRSTGSTGSTGSQGAAGSAGPTGADGAAGPNSSFVGLRRVDLIGHATLAELYGPLLRDAGFEVRVADEHAGARGLQRIARHAGLPDR